MKVIKYIKYKIKLLNHDYKKHYGFSIIIKLFLSKNVFYFLKNIVSIVRLNTFKFNLLQ